MSAIDCIITAAGLSSRMGQWKMMLPWEQGTILDTSIKNAGNDSNLLIVFYVQIMPDDFVMQLHR
ncbi:hypothetical protein P9380_16635, partial [Escherichia coli]